MDAFAAEGTVSCKAHRESGSRQSSVTRIGAQGVFSRETVAAHEQECPFALVGCPFPGYGQRCGGRRRMRRRRLECGGLKP